MSENAVDQTSFELCSAEAVEPSEMSHQPDSTDHRSPFGNRRSAAAASRTSTSSVEPSRVGGSTSSRGLLLIAFVMIAAAIALGWRMVQPERKTAETVRREVIEGVLSGTRFGPFFVQATGYDPETREFERVSIDSEDFLVGASRAEFAIDAAADSITLTLIDAVLLREPTRGQTLLVALDRQGRYSLGPFELEVDVID